VETLTVDKENAVRRAARGGPPTFTYDCSNSSLFERTPAALRQIKRRASRRLLPLKISVSDSAPSVFSEACSLLHGLNHVLRYRAHRDVAAEGGREVTPGRATENQRDVRERAVPRSPEGYDDCGDDCSESVREYQTGLQSFRSMRRMDARRKNASTLRFRFSQSFASRRQGNDPKARFASSHISKRCYFAPNCGRSALKLRSKPGKLRTGKPRRGFQSNCHCPGRALYRQGPARPDGRPSRRPPAGSC
jgi:hypothetical protein